MSAAGYVLTYRRHGAAVGEVFACAECAEPGANAYCDCLYFARCRAAALDTKHEIHRGERLVSYSRTESTGEAEAVPRARAE